MRLGLNPYGLTWTLGLQGRGTPRANPAGRGLDGFLALAEELDAKVLEIFDPWLQAMPDAEVEALGARPGGARRHPGGELRHRHDGDDGGRLPLGAAARRASDPARTDADPLR